MTHYTVQFNSAIREMAGLRAKTVQNRKTVRF